MSARQKPLSVVTGIMSHSLCFEQKLFQNIGLFYCCFKKKKLSYFVCFTVAYLLLISIVSFITFRMCCFATDWCIQISIAPAPEGKTWILKLVLHGLDWRWMVFVMKSATHRPVFGNFNFRHKTPVS